MPLQARTPVTHPASRLATALAAALVSTVIAAGSARAADKGHDHAHPHQPLHGGVVVEVRDIDYELVARPTLLQLHLRDHGKPVDVARASARLTLLTGSHRQEVELKPAGNRLEASGSFQVGPGSKAVAVVTVDGKPASVRFSLP